MDMEDDEHDDAKEEVEEEEPMEVEPSTKGRKKKKRTSNAEAWKTISIDPITSANQNANTYWSRIKTAFDERKLVDPNFAIIYMDRGEKAMANHWATIQMQQVAWDSREDYGSPGKRRQLQASRMSIACRPSFSSCTSLTLVLQLCTWFRCSTCFSRTITIMSSSSFMCSPGLSRARNEQSIGWPRAVSTTWTCRGWQKGVLVAPKGP